MRLSIITPTAGRQAGIALAERWMARQTVQPFEWIVADGGMAPAVLTEGQRHLHAPSRPGPANFAGNVLRALDAVTGDAVVIVEDDDYYFPNHLQLCRDGLVNQAAYGCATLNYFNVAERCWIRMSNRGSALCQTAFRVDLIPQMQESARRALGARGYGVDGGFWGGMTSLARGATSVIGIKGLAGTPGLGIGHRPRQGARRHQWRSDPTLAKLQEWIGADVEHYRC